MFERIAKGLVPELRHSSDKAQSRAVAAIRRREDADEDEVEEPADDGPPVPLLRVFKLVRPEIRRLGIAMAAVSVSSLATLAFPTAVGTGRRKCFHGFYFLDTMQRR